MGVWGDLSLLSSVGTTVASKSSSALLLLPLARPQRPPDIRYHRHPLDSQGDPALSPFLPSRPSRSASPRLLVHARRSLLRRELPSPLTGPVQTLDDPRPLARPSCPRTRQQSILSMDSSVSTRSVPSTRQRRVHTGGRKAHRFVPPRRPTACPSADRVDVQLAPRGTQTTRTQLDSHEGVKSRWRQGSRRDHKDRPGRHPRPVGRRRPRSVHACYPMFSRLSGLTEITSDMCPPVVGLGRGTKELNKFLLCSKVSSPPKPATRSRD